MLVVPVHVHLLLEGSSSLCICLQVTEWISKHYWFVETATKCSGNHSFCPEKHLFEGKSLTLRIQSTGARILTHHLLVSVSSLYK